MSNIYPINILDMIKEMGEGYVKVCLSHFACKNNNERDAFLKNRAIEFSKKGLSITYLVFEETEETIFLLGYFTLAYKIIQIPQSCNISNTMKKKISPFAEYDNSTETYTIPSPLIAQFGKNTNLPLALYKEFHGKELMKIAIEQILKIKHMIGGRIVYLECEDNPFLLDFYNSEGYVKFNKRYTNNESNVEYYHQLLKII